MGDTKKIINRHPRHDEQKRESDSKKKERHIVSWSQEEDDILRQHISIHGTENWAAIASRFKDKTTRQCRRRWYTYLNSDFKKGGWSPEEDMLLCEAQKVFGNRWTEIAKVVSGRTDNAVKNRFSTLCKKRAKYEATAKENSTSYFFSNTTNKGLMMFPGGFNTDAPIGTETPPKNMRRARIPEVPKNLYFGDRSHEQYYCGTREHEHPRTPLAVLDQNFHNIPSSVQNNKIEGMFLKKDDPKVRALMQQAELLTSLALKLNTENTDECRENSSKIVQGFLNPSKEADSSGHKAPRLTLEALEHMVEVIRSSNEGSKPFWREPDFGDHSPQTSEYSSGSTLVPHLGDDNLEESLLYPDIQLTELRSTHIEEEIGVDESEERILCSPNKDQDILPSCVEQINIDGVVSAPSTTDQFSSPFQMTPCFRSLATGVPSPKFSESSAKLCHICKAHAFVFALPV